MEGCQSVKQGCFWVVKLTTFEGKNRILKEASIFFSVPFFLQSRFKSRKPQLKIVSGDKNQRSRVSGQLSLVEVFNKP